MTAPAQVASGRRPDAPGIRGRSVVSPRTRGRGPRWAACRLHAWLSGAWFVSPSIFILRAGYVCVKNYFAFSTAFFVDRARRVRHNTRRESLAAAGAG